ncbi:hypothetical protein ACFOY4_41530 [Actinomadura syzygii]|uniref:Uncharacterized protein n=1 Tax=Actinomadura syzygii TaxID=1427538 RepID=A0A5D0TQB9_9ACTN|nr:hypothetical protein [Actinomadura syzygii]TYC07600.1 hypothetical protein FXF65_42125 [Actinomadura syzygii]
MRHVLDQLGDFGEEGPQSLYLCGESAALCLHCAELTPAGLEVLMFFGGDDHQDAAVQRDALGL